MRDHRFFPAPPVISVAQVAELAGAALVRGEGTRQICGAAPIESAGPGELTFLDNPKYAKHLEATAAAACLCGPRFSDRVPGHVAVLQSDQPYQAYARYLAFAFPKALRPTGIYSSAEGSEPRPTVHPTALVEQGASIEPGAVVGARAEIGSGTTVAANAVIGEGVAIGRDCFIGSNAVLQHCLLGNRVIIHPGVCIGQDGFGFAMGAEGHRKVAQIGRVIIQDDVEIGSNSTLDRGANRDTVIGEGTKIDNQVQIGHNVEIGRHCVIVSQVGIAGSSRLGDFVAIGGQTGVNGHVSIGDGAQIAAISVVHGDVPPGARWGGFPARPVGEWFRELAALRRLARKSRTD